ncbi:MAG: class I SAM-dependent methyltransferase, partial [Armatimonadetes bacterium]|nr:class I SAM-dependent methyltransferase [Armatimonadota bacterium]
MPDDWKNPEFAQEWDRENMRGNPTRPEQLDLLLALLEDELQPGQAILDLGIGSGRVAEMILQRLPAAHLVGVDHSPAMLALARERLAPFAGRFEVVEHDLSDLQTLRLPEREYPVAISVQTLHHLEPEANRQALRWLSHCLPDGGLFLTLERIAIRTPHLFSLYKSLWKRLERIYDVNVPGGDSYEEHWQRLD